MSEPDVEPEELVLGASTLRDIFPFFFALDRELRLTHFGRSLPKVCSNLHVGAPLQALFSIFRHTHESALYTIVKSAGSGGEAQFTVLSGRQRVRIAPTLPEALDYFRSKLALVPGGGG